LFRGFSSLLEKKRDLVFPIERERYSICQNALVQPGPP
jgi:hypothetical protein